jgi:hypothetical protein
LRFATMLMTISTATPPAADKANQSAVSLPPGLFAGVLIMPPLSAESIR